MPLYEYQCEKCGYSFEKVQSFDEAPVHICPCCGGKVNRLLHSSAVIFKGSGFYSTDRREDGRAK